MLPFAAVVRTSKTATPASSALYRRHVEATEAVGSASRLSTGKACIKPGVRLSRGGGRAGDRGPGRVLDRVGPTRENPRSYPSELLRLSVADRDARIGDGLARFLPGRGSRVPGGLPGHSGTQGERLGRHRDCGSADCAGAWPDPGVRVAHPAWVPFS